MKIKYSIGASFVLELELKHRNSDQKPFSLDNKLQKGKSRE